MTTLREKIESILHEYYNNESQPTHKTTSEILDIYEKGIDEIKEQYMKYYAIPDLINEIKEMLK